MTSLAIAVCSVTRTQRGRYFWAAWWTHPPDFSPFRKPDASNGGATSEEEAFRDAQRATGRQLQPIEPYWAHAWNRMLRGESPPPMPKPKQKADNATTPTSAWSVLGLEPGATHAELKAAYRRKALESHPDRGGDPATFRAVVVSYEKLIAKRRR
jgi:hypothetical protein